MVCVSNGAKSELERRSEGGVIYVQYNYGSAILATHSGDGDATARGN